MLYLSIIGFAEADDANAVSRLGETKDVQPSAKTPERDISKFAIFLPCVNLDVRSFKFELSGKLERKAALPDIPLVLARIETYARSQIVCTVCLWRNSFG